jgi:hypothetical protein
MFYNWGRWVMGRYMVRGILDEMVRRALYGGFYGRGLQEINRVWRKQIANGT